LQKKGLKYFIRLSYLGKAYCGWQIQPDQPSVQETLTKGIQTALQEEIELVGSGRTDTGVHAKNYIAHFTCQTRIEDKTQFIFKINTLLPKDISMHSIWEVKDDAHARFNALSRTYTYWVTQEKNPFLLDQAYYVKRKLDLKQMNLAASELKNYRNFKAFSKVKTQVYTYNCQVTEAHWKVLDNGVLAFTITANRFLRNMVRAIVGTLIEVGLNKISLTDFKQIIESENRSNAGKSVPAEALCLYQVTYPKELTEHE
jgi:tRNA pseudouridine38-40 synthase